MKFVHDGLLYDTETSTAVGSFEWKLGPSENHAHITWLLTPKGRYWKLIDWTHPIPAWEDLPELKRGPESYPVKDEHLFSEWRCDFGLDSALEMFPDKVEEA